MVGQALQATPKPFLCTTTSLHFPVFMFVYGIYLVLGLGLLSWPKGGQFRTREVTVS